MTLLLASILGALFGFVLQKTGAANPHRIIGMLRLQDFHLIKAILIGIGISSFLLYLLMPLGFIQVSHISIKPAYIGVVVGGAILGVGWAIAGYCPGTGLVAAGSGRRDALYFIIGGLVGAFVYMLVFSTIEGSFLFKSLGGEIALVDLGSDDETDLLFEYYKLAIAGFTSALFIILAYWLPERSDDSKP